MTMRDAALDLARRGFRVHPLRGKVPLLKDWPAHATTELDKVELLWTQHPHANVGVATGGELLVLDVDTAKGKPGEASLKALVEKNGALPRTVVARTGSGGWHYYFRTNVEGLRNSAGKLGTGLDVRAEGGQVAAPPSKHESGRRYEWAPGFGPAEVDIAPAPAWLVDLLRPAPLPAPAPRRPAVDEPSAYARAQAYLAKLDPSVQGQNGSGALWKAAQALVRGFLLPEAEALALLASEFNPRCVPPWSEKELQHKVSDAASKSSLPHGWLLDAERPDDRPARPLRAVPPEPPPPTDADAPPDVDEPAAAPGPPASNVRPLRPSTAAAPQTDGALALAPPANAPSRPLTKSYASICQILRTPALREQVLGKGDLEFNEQTLEPCFNRQPLREEHLAAIRERCELSFTSKKKGIQFGQGDVEKAVLQVAKERRFHPVADYLRGLVWDGVPRIRHLAEDVLHLDTSSKGQPLAPVIIRKWMIAAVARALDPGCKVDNVLIIVGRQGKKKSTFLETLAGKEAFSDSPIDLHDKDGKLALRAIWVLEWAELDSLMRAKSQNSVKAFVTSKVDLLRPPFERAVRPIPRCAVITGSTNEDEFLSDPTGSRRFWPLKVAELIEVALLRQQRDQLWGEALHAYTAAATCSTCQRLAPGRCDEHSWWLNDAQERELRGVNEAFERQDPWEEPVLTAAQRWLAEQAKKQPELGDKPEHLTTADLLASVKKDTGQWSTGDSMRVAAIMKKAGWRQIRPYDPDNPKAPRPRAWQPPGGSP